MHPDARYADSSECAEQHEPTGNAAARRFTSKMTI